MAAHQASPSLGFSRQEHWSGLPFPSPMHESEKWKRSCTVVSNSSQLHGLQPTRLLRPWDFLGKSTGVGCHWKLNPASHKVPQKINKNFEILVMKHKQGNFEREEACTYLAWVWGKFKLETRPKSPENMFNLLKTFPIWFNKRDLQRRGGENGVSLENKTTWEVFQEYDLLPYFLISCSSLGNSRF